LAVVTLNPAESPKAVLLLPPMLLTSAFIPLAVFKPPVVLAFSA
jgi:hypothetical protein